MLAFRSHLIDFLFLLATSSISIPKILNFCVKMCDWISKLFQQLLNSLNEHHEVTDNTNAMQTIAIFEQTELTRKQLEDSNIVKKVENLRIRTSNQYLAYRLELLLGKWHTFLQKDLRMAQSQQIKSNSVFEAIIQNDEEFFETDNIYELMRRLDKSFGTNGKVLDMATALNTIAILHDIHIPDNELTKVTFHLKRLRRLSVNKYLLGRITALLVKCKELKRSDMSLVFPSSPELENFE